MKIAFFDIKEDEIKFFETKLKKHKLKFFKEAINENLAEKVKDYDVISVFIYSKIDAPIINKFRNLKMISTRSTGFDHIDVSECTKKNIDVCNVPSYGENTVAEHTFGLILSLSRNIHKSFARTMNNNYSIEGLTGFDLKGKTIGIIGGGRIGMHVARMAKGFDMKVFVYDIKKDQFLKEVIGFEYAELDFILKNSDIISLHAPYNEHTHHLINKKNIKTIKKGTLLINTARGGLIETEALVYALENKILSGAGLDVIEGEELIKEEHQLLDEKSNPEKFQTIMRDKKIFGMDNVIFTPHNAFNSKESLLRILETTVENIELFCLNTPKNIILIKK